VPSRLHAAPEQTGGKTSTRKYLAELLGTFLFLTIGHASVAAFGAADASGLLVVPFSFSLGLLAAIFAVGHISGGHFNPAVTVAMILDRRILPMDALGYILAQTIGALGAAAVVLVVAGRAAVAAGATRPGGGVRTLHAMARQVRGQPVRRW
jgi:glycerol uptake facilitator-like aquaporin